MLPEVTELKLLDLKERGLLLAYRWEKKKREQSGSGDRVHLVECG